MGARSGVDHAPESGDAAPVALLPPLHYLPSTKTTTGADTLVWVVPILWVARWRIVLENDGASAGNITAVSLRRSAIGTHYGPPVAETVAAPVTPGNAWGGSDSGDCVAMLEITATVSGAAEVTLTAAGQ